MSGGDSDELKRIRREFGRQEAIKRAQEYGIPYADLTKFKPESDALALLPRALAVQHTLLPLKKNDDALYIAMADIGDMQALDAARLACRCTVRPVMGVREEIQEAIARLYPADQRHTLKNALEKDGWTITQAPLHLTYAGHDLICDMEARKQMDEVQKTMAVQSAAFSDALPLDEMTQALGRHLLCLSVLEAQNSARVLYMAVSHKDYEALSANDIGTVMLQSKNLRLLVFDNEGASIISWHENTTE